MGLTLVLLLLPAQPPADAGDREVWGRTLTFRRARRDEALRKVGERALGFTQAYGEDGVKALLACDPGTGERLVALHEDGALAKLAAPKPLVAAVARHGEKVGAWVAEHHGRLADRAALEAFLKEPLEYVHDMKALKAPEPAPGAEALLRRYWKEALLAVGLPLFFYLGWRRRRAAP